MVREAKTAKVGADGRVTIPKGIREALCLQPGDRLWVRVENGHIVLVPEARRDPGQSWFWTEEWQEGEREADEDIRADRVFGPFTSAEEMKKYFQALKDEFAEREED